MTHYLPAGGTGAGPYALEITPETAGWTYSALRVLELDGAHTFETGPYETLVLPLSGSCRVSCDGETFELRGRRSVFTRVTDFAYVPRDAAVTVTGRGRFALPAARCENRLTARYGPAEDVPVELRGAGQMSRQVNNFCTPEAFEADRLIACEVITPGGNWSSYPPHKHDEDRPGESVLEEIYYFEVRDAGRSAGAGWSGETRPAGVGRPGETQSAGAGRPGETRPAPMAYQRVYGTADRPIDVLEEVRTGDTVLIPHGWHGPSMAVPGYDLYYLNVMAGPSPERAWRICDDPAHAWVRGTWEGQEIDPRLPLTSTTEEER
ncbi:5-deoxy-glucuronate isomerase [Actinoallomurus soli]|uniref:5-deoxy-glucuronate isomerase n=1 Tax=Actinoallomurus soli TaxID=2952535 RepID=UPI0020929543|nr:5-deoxy-glucuronate isomerase [Actinoallomurus soli]MCO5967429.1 5-deoxy-glucuronate isomerase [Actinoallomurus soli]